MVVIYLQQVATANRLIFPNYFYTSIMMCGPGLSIFIHIGPVALCELTVDGAKHIARYFIAGTSCFCLNKYFR